MTTPFDVIEQFATRPTLRSVAAQMLSAALSERYPDLAIDPAQVCVSPAHPEARSALSHPSLSLVGSLLVHFLQQSTPHWPATDYALMPLRGNSSPLAVAMPDISAVVDRCAFGLMADYKQAVADFWSQTSSLDGAAMTRWAWLAECIRQRLLDELQTHDCDIFDPEQKTALTNVAQLRAHVGAQAGVAWVTVTQGTASDHFPLPMLVVVERKKDQSAVLVYRLCGQFERYSLAAWEARLRQDFIAGEAVEHLRWALYEPQGNVFDGLAQAVLEHQLNTLGMFRRDAGHVIGSDVEVLERYFDAVTDVGALFISSPRAFDNPHLTAARLPDWLRNAAGADRLVFSRSMAALAALQVRNKGQAFDDDLPPIRTFACQALRKKMLEEHPDARDLPLAEIELVIDKVTAVAAGTGGQMSALGEVQTVRMELVDFALENLVGLPVGKVSVQRTTDEALPQWLTVDYVKKLVHAVDIGGVYPQLLRKSLVTDAVEAERRRLLFCAQLRIQLPLKALEQKLRGQGAVSAIGCECVAGLMTSQAVSGQVIVLRPLAFLAAPQRRPDLVGNLFVIGPQDTAAGPHLLYQPFCAQPLTEFSSWSALREAVAQGGELQDNVLRWLSDSVRAVYAQGGFDEPHIVRFGPGSEFAPLERPQPAALCRDTVVGDPLRELFDANAQALVALADRSSVSNVESRWASLKEGGWLLLNALLPILGNTLGNSLWLLQVFSSVGKVVALPESADRKTRSEAISDLLLNIAMIVLHQGFSVRGLTRHPPAVEPSEAATSNASTTAVQRLDLSASQTQLDFSWSNPVARLTADQRNRLAAYQFSAEPLLGERATSGVHADLYAWQGHWYAWVDGHVYRVIVSEDGVRVATPGAPVATGPWLIRGAEAWRFDFGLRLRGGGPKQNARKLAQANAENTKRINDRLAELQRRSSELVKATRAYLSQLKTAQGAVRQLFIERYESDLTKLLDVVQEHVKLALELRPGDRPSEKDLATGLKAMARYICYFEELLLNDQQALATQELAHMRTLMPVDAVVPENSAAYFELFRKLTMIQIKGVRWASIREELWVQLRAVPKVGERYWHDEVLDIYAHRHPSALEWQAVHMFSTLELVFSDPEVMFSDDLKLLRVLRNDDNLHAAIASHVEVDKPNNYSRADCISVVESALKEYEKAGDVATYIHSLDFAGVKGDYLEQFITQIDGIRDAVLKRLAALIKESADESAQQLEYLPKLARPGKRVIRTRGHRTLVGNVREGEAALEGDVVDVTDGLTSKVIQSWHQHADGDWVEVVQAGVVQVPEVKAAPVNTALLAQLQEQTKVLLDRVEVSIQNAWRQSKRANEPADMEDILLQKAEKLTGLALQMQPFSADAAALSTSVSARLVTQLQDLPVAASRLRAQGREIRIAMIKTQPPTAGRISYLHQQREINISSFDGRKNMSGSRRDDFLQEFAIRDTDNKILWWAHFHYAAEDARAEAFTAAHLKLPEQRFLGYKALIRDARAGADVVSIYRSSIGKDIAQRLFLCLTP